jgi:tetratricopeptide (TPR) repeat protein
VRNCRSKIVFVVTAAIGLAACSPIQRAARHEHKGRQLFAKKDYARAALEFKTAAQLTPRNAELWYQLGLTCLSLNDVACAVGSLRQATEINANHLDAQLKLAAIYAASGQQGLLVEGEKRIRQVLDRSPGNAQAWQTFGIIEIRLNKAQEASVALEGALRKLPGNVTVSAALARAKYAAGDSGGAGQVLQQAVKTNPKSAEAALALAQFEMASGSREQASAEFQRVLELDGKNATALAALAELARKGGQIPEAERLYQRLAAAGPQYKLAYARFLLSQRKLQTAAGELERLARENPADREIRGTLVATYVELGRTGEAERVVDNALAHNPLDMDALLERGELRLRAGRLTEAEHDFSGVIGYERRSANAHYDLSMVWYRRGDARLQRNELTQALEINPNLLAARIALAQNFLASGHPQSALDLMESAPEPQKRTPGAIVARSSALVALGQREEARKSIEQALRVSSAPELLLAEAQMDAESKDYAKARMALAKLLKQSPDNEEALNLLAETYASEGHAQGALNALAPYASQTWRAKEVLGTWLIRSGKTAEGRTVLESAAGAGPQAYEAKIRLAQLDIQETKPQAARKDMEAVVRAHPDSVLARLILAHAAQMTGDSRTAVEQYRSVVDLNKNNLEALNNLAYLLARQKSNEAMTYAQEALAIAPRRATVLETAAFAFYQKGMYKEAITNLEKAEATEPTPRRQYHLAIAYFAAGDFEKGRPILNIALAEDPQLAKTEHDWQLPDSEATNQDH